MDIVLHTQEFNFSKLSQATIFLPEEKPGETQFTDTLHACADVQEWVDVLGLRYLRNYCVVVPGSFHEELVTLLRKQAHADTLEEFLNRPLVKMFNVTINVDTGSVYGMVMVTIYGDGVTDFSEDETKYIKGDVENIIGPFGVTVPTDQVIMDSPIVSLFTSTDKRWLGTAGNENAYRAKVTPLHYRLPNGFDQGQIDKFLARRNKGMTWEKWITTISTVIGHDALLTVRLRQQVGFPKFNIVYAKHEYMGADHHVFFVA